MKSKKLATSKLAIGEARDKDMSSEIAAVEQQWKDLKEKKENLDKAIGKLWVDIIRAASKLSKKQIQHEEKAIAIEHAHNILEEAKSTIEAFAWRQEDLKLSIKALLGWIFLFHFFTFRNCTWLFCH